MCDPTQYNPALLAQDIQNSAYHLPDLAQQYLRRARGLRLESVDEAAEDQNLKARLRRGVQWFVASLAYAIRPWTDEQRFMVLTRVLMADRSLMAIMDTVEEGAFIPDDWISMFGLLTDELSFRDYEDLALEIFKPFVGWMETRPPAATSINVTTPILTASVDSIEPPPLFLPSPAIPPENPSNSTMKLKRARPVSPSMTEAQGSKRQKVASSKEDVPNLQVIPASPPSLTTKSGLDEIPQAFEPLGPAITLTPAVWRVSSSSPLAQQAPRFSSPDNSVLFLSDPVPAPSRTPTPPCERKERKFVSSRTKFTPTRNFGSSTVLVPVPVDKSASVSSGKLESSSKSVPVVAGRSDPMCKTKSAPSRTSGYSVKSVWVSKAVASNKSVSSGKSVASSKSTLPSKTASSSNSANASKTSTTISSGKSASFSKPVNPEKFVPSRRKSESGSNLSNVPRTPQPNCLNLQRRLVIISPPPRPPKSTHRI